MIFFGTFAYDLYVAKKTKLVFEAYEAKVHGFLELGRHVDEPIKTSFESKRAGHVTTYNSKVTVICVIRMKI